MKKKMLSVFQAQSRSSNQSSILAVALVLATDLEIDSRV